MPFLREAGRAQFCWMKLEVDETVQAELRDRGYARVRSNLSRTPWRVGIVGHFAHVR